jgi:hypothetical protein
LAPIGSKKYETAYRLSAYGARFLLRADRARE